MGWTSGDVFGVSFDDLFAVVYLVSGAVGVLLHTIPALFQQRRLKAWFETLLRTVNNLANFFCLAACINVSQLVVIGHGIDAACTSSDVSNATALSAMSSLALALCFMSSPSKEIQDVSFAFASVTLGCVGAAGTSVLGLSIVLVVTSFGPLILLHVLLFGMNIFGRDPSITAKDTEQRAFNWISLVTMYSVAMYAGGSILRNKNEQLATFICERDADMITPTTIWGFSLACVLIVRLWLWTSAYRVASL
jgi:hypothetical protein